MKLKIFQLCLLLLLVVSPALAWDQINFNIIKQPGAPYFIGQPEVNVDTDEFNTIILKIKSTQSCTARLYWASTLFNQINPAASIWFYINKSDSYHEYVFNVPSQNVNWLGYVPQILIYPDKNLEGIEIISAQANHNTIFNNIRSGWQEFWGPNGRGIIGSTINVIKSTTLFGLSINTIAYWAILLTFLLFLARSFQVEKVISLALWESVGKKTVMATILIWGMLEISTLVTYWQNIKNDYSRYYGKSVSAKAEQAVGPALYKFISFCRETLPKSGANIAMVWPDQAGYLALSARYYLFPNLLGNNTNPNKDTDYILVFQKENYTFPGYSLFKRLSNNEYILRKT